jgi:glycine/D-amino acid oxidase-like deaminating enzyme
MKQNNSPWLTQLHPDRKTNVLESDTTADVVIVGGGIAGVTTLYFLLKNTDKKIILVEGDKLAHGATGHNAGQVVAEFERPLSHLAREHGMKKAVAGLADVEHAWELLGDIMDDTKIEVPFKEFIGYGGYTEIEQLIADLETELIKSKHGLLSFPTFVSRESGWLEKIPKEFHEICVEVDQQVIMEALGIKAGDYNAALPEKKGTMNSALFTEKLAMWCTQQFPDRAQIFEYTFVHGIELDEKNPLVITNLATITTEQIVLCTNGFENFYIHDKKSLEIDTKFHHLVEGAVGYMTGYLTKQETDPMANYYYEEGKKRGADPYASDPYFYITRRKFGTNESSGYLMSVGGPEVQLIEREIYFREFDVAEKFQQDSVAFTEKYFDMTGYGKEFFWHGLMGYTRTGVRVVGREPLDKRLLYNLGCNGVGILPSIMGARKIARHIEGEEMQETIFDPQR